LLAGKELELKTVCPERYSRTNLEVMLSQAGEACGHTTDCEPVFTLERLTAGGCGALKRRSPIGGAAYLMLEKV